MKPINQPERRKAFLHFLLFFALTIAVIITAVIFSVQVPFKENDKLTKDAAVYANEQAILKSFEVSMDETVALIDSLPRAGKYYTVVNNEINKKMDKMAALINDSVSQKSFYTSVIANLSSLQSTKNQLKDAIDNKTDMGALRNEKNEWETRYNTLRTEYQNYIDKVNQSKK